MIAKDFVAALRREGAKKNTLIQVLFEDGSIGDILMVERDSDGTVYLKVETCTTE